MKVKYVLPIGIICSVLLCSQVLASEAGVIIDGRTMVPVRGVFESLGFTVSWDATTKEATVSNENHNVVVKNGADYFVADGKTIQPDVPQQNINGSMYLPLKAIGDAVGATTDWNSEDKIAHISFEGKDVYVECGNTTSNKEVSSVSDDSTNNNTNSDESINNKTDSDESINENTTTDENDKTSTERTSTITTRNDLTESELEALVDDNRNLFIGFAEDCIRSGKVANDIYDEKLQNPESAKFSGPYAISPHIEEDGYSAMISRYVTSKQRNGSSEKDLYMVSVEFQVDTDNNPINIKLTGVEFF